ncbi:M50 family metallopeptidase [Candidatus Woesearchaeota archaeon]|nr:M50 family metallopeptidase [Candidatus Woesearchaeota archaeon]
MVLSIQEITDIILMSIAVGYILMGIFSFRKNKSKKLFDWQAFKFSVIVTAPALILHELGHKFVAMAYGLQPTFHAAYAWLGIGIALKLLRTGFIFFVPAYVSICPTGQCNISPLGMSAIAFAGPLMNLILFLAAWILLKSGKQFSPKMRAILHVTKIINLILFAFNMLPIPMFDGLKVYQGLWRAFF